jgi:hypothetical protein
VTAPLLPVPRPMGLQSRQAAGNAGGAVDACDGAGTASEQDGSTQTTIEVPAPARSGLSGNGPVPLSLSTLLPQFRTLDPALEARASLTGTGRDLLPALVRPTARLAEPERAATPSPLSSAASPPDDGQAGRLDAIMHALAAAKPSSALPPGGLRALKPSSGQLPPRLRHLCRKRHSVPRRRHSRRPCSPLLCQRCRLLRRLAGPATRSTFALESSNSR